MIEVQRTMRAQRLHRIEGAFLVRQIHVGLPNFVARTLPSSALAPYSYVPIGCITRSLTLFNREPFLQYSPLS